MAEWGHCTDFFRGRRAVYRGILKWYALGVYRFHPFSMKNTIIVVVILAAVALVVYLFSTEAGGNMLAEMQLTGSTAGTEEQSTGDTSGDVGGTGGGASSSEESGGIGGPGGGAQSGD